MNDTEFDKLLDKVIQSRKLKIADMKMSAIIFQNYNKFEKLRTTFNLQVGSDFIGSIQDILTKAGKFQKDGSPISRFQISTEMNRTKKKYLKLDKGENNE